MKKALFFLSWTILLTIPFQTIRGQDTLSTGAEMMVIEQANTKALLDNLGQVYALSPENELIKYNQQGKPIFHFANNSMGSLGQVDVSNPLYVTLFYPTLNTVIVLDRTLSPLWKIDLSSLGFFNVSAICSSREGTLWLFDADQNRLVQLSIEGKILASSRNLQLNFASFVPFDFLVEHRGRVYGHSRIQKNVLVFDLRGNHLQTLPPTPAYFQLNGLQLSFFESPIFTIRDHYNALLPLIKQWLVPGTAHTVMKQKEYIMLATPEGIGVFKWKYSQ